MSIIHINHTFDQFNKPTPLPWDRIEYARQVWTNFDKFRQVWTSLEPNTVHTFDQFNKDTADGPHFYLETLLSKYARSLDQFLQV